MKKITRKQIEDLATKALLSENPYIKNAIKYKIGNVRCICTQIKL